MAARLVYGLSFFGAGVLTVFAISSAMKDVEKQMRMNDAPVTPEQMKALNQWKHRADKNQLVSSMRPTNVSGEQSPSKFK
mmetsp:Transcript_9341/g.13020  ORF Transcript_9341/g.13020 Transcript_9341/m.13020 type:complete len:80 (+) Transcript_9341:21-260(+)